MTIDGLQAGFSGGPAVLLDHVGPADAGGPGPGGPDAPGFGTGRRNGSGGYGWHPRWRRRGQMSGVGSPGGGFGNRLLHCQRLSGRQCDRETASRLSAGLTRNGRGLSLGNRSGGPGGLLHRLTLEVQMITRACGKYDVHNLEPEDLRALSIQTAAVTGVALAGSNRRYRGLRKR